MVNPLKNLRDLSNGGTGYAREQMNFAGFPDVVDSLLVIRKMCFEKQYCTLAELVEQCQSDWPNEGLRRIAENCPAFGDGSEESNALAAKLNTDAFCIFAPKMIDPPIPRCGKGIIPTQVLGFDLGL